MLPVAGLAILATAAAQGTPHPRLLIQPDDLPRLRHACGIGTTPPDTRGLGRFGACSDEFNALRAYFSQRLGDVVLPGELPAAAFLHLVDPDDPGAAARLAALNDALLRPIVLTGDPLETVLALDWCWDALRPAARREFLLQVRGSAEPLTAADSPLDHRAFRPKLAAVALVLAVDETDEPSPSWAVFRERILDAARAYFKTTWPTFVEWRGLIPTGPGAAAFEENDTALAVELAGLLDGSTTWEAYRDSVGRWMEHYVMVTSAHPALQHQFLRDDGSSAPPVPLSGWEALQPLTAHLIAARTGDPAAACVADRVEAAMSASVDQTGQLPWCWVPVVFDLSGLPRADPSHLPAARNLRGALVLRGGNDPGAAVVWIDAGQRFLRRGQHFDAGHFLIRAGGYLAVAGGDDVEFEATPAKGGVQQLGRASGPFDFAQYCTASIAHNCMIVWDATRVQRWYGRLYAPNGGQAPREGTCTDFSGSGDAQSRPTARLLAYAHEPDAAYAALDLTSAYGNHAVERYTREFLFLWGRVLIVIDRLKTAKPRVQPTWIINLPDRPTAEQSALAPQARVAGSDNAAGIWRYDDARWLRWQERDGALWLGCLLPEVRRTAIVGGPARRLRIPDGPHKGRTYCGGDSDGYERLVRPSSRPRPANAWYRLGRPTLLGPQFGARPHWGRVEVEPVSADQYHLFVNALVIDRAESATVPDVRLAGNDGSISIALSVDGRRGRLIVPSGLTLGGEVHCDEPASWQWDLPADVQRDADLQVK
jgi:hypothetical protein